MTPGRSSERSPGRSKICDSTRLARSIGCDAPVEGGIDAPKDTRSIGCDAPVEGGIDAPSFAFFLFTKVSTSKEMAEAAVATSTVAMPISCTEGCWFSGVEMEDSWEMGTTQSGCFHGSSFRLFDFLAFLRFFFVSPSSACAAAATLPYAVEYAARNWRTAAIVGPPRAVSNCRPSMSAMMQPHIFDRSLATFESAAV